MLLRVPVLLLLAGCGTTVVEFTPDEVSDTDTPVTDDPDDSADPLEPDITVDPTTLDLGVSLGGATVTATFTVGNAGSAALLGGVEVAGEGFGIDITTLSLAPDEDAVVTVTFAAAPVGIYSGLVTITSDDPDEGSVVVIVAAEVGADGDGDGFAGSDDCDDENEAINPDAVETWYDGVDQDCSGGSDYDQDGDGHDAAEHAGEDCDDEDATVSPSAEEVWYDGFDQDCDGRSDSDQDGDGYDDAGHGGDDCDDTNASANIGTLEDTTNGIDDDCDGEIDETLSSVDTDGDGYSEVDGDCLEGDAEINPGATETWYDGVDQDCSGGSDYDQDGDGVESDAYGGTDCDDADVAVLPGAAETWYDGVDQDCDGADDYDQDADGDRASAHGGGDCDDTDSAVSSLTVESWYDGVDQDCSGGSDYDADADGSDALVGGGTDCDDLDASVNTGAVETWYDGVDQDCDGADDYDQDGDGYTASATGGEDCDDTDATVNPDAEEAWYDGVDQDCDGASDYDQDGDGHELASEGGTDCDDADAAVNPDATETWYDGVDQDCDGANDYDQDGDGHEASSSGGTDCDDTDGSISPDATEVWYDDVDQDCDGASDHDQDLDGFDASSGGGADCDDVDTNVNPSAAEVCDGVDQDCNGTVDDGVLETFYADADADGYGDAASTTEACEAPSGYAASSTDCDDGDASVNPGESESCNAVDDDCDGSIDEGLSTSTYYRDADSDGYGDATYSTSNCSAPSGYVTDATDCDDGESTTNPGADEVAYDTTDNDCDDLPDEMLASEQSSWTILGERTSDGIGSWGLHTTDDQDGDGDPELVICAGSYNSALYTDIGVTAFHDVDTSGLDMSVTDGYLEIYGDSGDDFVGSSFAVVDDLDGGGAVELAFGAYQSDDNSTDDGTVYLFDIDGWSAFAPASWYSDGEIAGRSSSGYFGYSMSAGDFDGDGVNDLAVGAPGEEGGKGQVYVAFDGDGLGDDDIDNEDANFWVRGVSGNDHLGYSVALGELNGDGYDDLVACSPDDDDSGSGSGTCWLVVGASTRSTSGSIQGSTVSSVDTAVITGSAASDQLGKTPNSISIGDFDGDTNPDLALGMPGYGSDDGGAVVIYRNGTLSGTETTATAAWLVQGDGALGTGVNMTGDVTGDGIVDLLAGATTAGSADEGVVYLLEGDVATGTWTLPTDQYASWTGEAASDLFGAAISGLRDLDGDGVLDFAVTATGNDDGASGAGKVYVLPAYP